eukprot:3378315-Rhodomonas_salina.1
MIRTQAQATRDELQSITTKIDLIHSQAQAPASDASGTHSAAGGRVVDAVQKSTALMAIDHLNTTISNFKHDLDHIVRSGSQSQFDREPCPSV